jgi:FAD/FMN-containing dehydrogenase
VKLSAQDIEDIVGADNVSVHDETRRLYSGDISSLPGLAYQIINDEFDIVVQPQTVKSLMALVKYAHINNIPVVPRGSATSGWGGVLPARGGVCLSLLHMTDFHHLDEYNLLVTVDSGITWQELLRILEQVGLTLPVYPSSASSATVGGFVASGGFGIGSAHYGDIRTQVEGVEAVLPNGMLVRCGNVVLKGEDNEKKEAEEGTAYLNSLLEQLAISESINPLELFLGTYGTFGVLTKVTLKVIPKLMLRTLACVFDNIDDLARAAIDIQSRASPYHLRFLTETYTTKRFSLRRSIDEYGKFILTCALIDTYYQIDESVERIESIVKDNNGWLTGDRRAEYHWEERFYPLRIKALGPSLVPAEVLIRVEKMPDLYKEIVRSIGRDSIAVEGTIGTGGITSLLAWILDDERRRLKYTVGWYRSFDIAAKTAEYGGKPYAVALWNVPYARQFYGEAKQRTLRRVKEELDPKDLMNPMKVFGGRIVAKRKSLGFGFIMGYIIALITQSIASFVPGLTWLTDVLWTPISTMLPIPASLLVAVIGGVLGLLFIRYLTLQRALRLGIPALKMLRHFVHQ